ncbi:hypothetical protein P0F37_000973 [Vibrio metschnikovii]|uniref:hypothetical protein n=1 Tax=Vibrio metschnikovii TaxID=28172 RepID=UPI00164872B8|nr:hypothetical protein [Vibrio metschnikovii]EKO3607501.1 hypothetical protein [Vibrio metschnikovii]EKO3609470.1 hypothetical protein [Vibrio metschnikovii]EKO3618113.1 hypothetical protein [Vibrio metschnikovii]EKO3638799.1 hypothetical protein [Vibrio metschnikovii]EKO3682272.1 hypothetical protein [Vibrio metschnikovii]
MNSIQPYENRTRLVGLDFLRGLVIFMAIFEHYTGYLNYWYVDFFPKESDFYETLYRSHLPMLGQLVPMDSFTGQVSAWLIPWVSQVYLALAAFNLSARSSEHMRATLVKKLALFLSIIFVLYIEGFIIAPNFGEAISFYPVMLWMTLLAFFSIVYAFFGIRGMLVLTVLSTIVSQLGVTSLLEHAELWMQTHVHPGYELDARLDLFMASGCFGFLYGWVWHHYAEKRDALNKLVLGIALVALSLYFLNGQAATIDLHDVYAEEHALAEDTIGRLGIWGTEFLVIGLILTLHQAGIRLSWRPLNWIGMYSLTVFIFHKSIFIFLWGPLLTWASAKMGTTLPNNFLLIFTLCSLSVGIIYLFKRSGIICHLMGDHQDQMWKDVYRQKRLPDAQ